jgi:RNA polymerase sigma factor (sigma-70 family)
MSEAAAQNEFRTIPGISGVLSDQRLARRAAAGDERAFAAIFRRYHQSLYRFCLAILANPEDAQDALQNTMVKALRALPGEERSIQLKPWLYRIAHNESIDLLRRRRESDELSPEQAATGAGLAEEAATRERLRRLIADIGELPERQRAALVMRELSGLNFDEIAASLGTSPAVARQTLYEARLSLRQMDEGRGMSCQSVTKALSDGDGRVTRRRDVRAHLRSCAACRDFRDRIRVRERDLGALSPLPAAGAAALLHGLLGGGSGSGGLAAALGGGAAKSVGASALLKGAATVAVVAAIGVTAADRGGLIDVGGSGGVTKATRSGAPAAAGRAARAEAEAAAGAGGLGTRQEGAKVDVAAGLGAAKGTGAAPAAGSVPPSSANTSEPLPSSSPAAAGPSEPHPNGRGHEKQRPSAAAKGQETAASHKATGRGAGAEKGHPAHSVKPAHPTNAAGDGKASPPASPNSTSAEGHSQAGKTNRAGASEEAPATSESGT